MSEFASEIIAIQKPVRKARRRLFFQNLVQTLPITLSLGLLASGVFLALVPSFAQATLEALRWWIVATVLFLSILAGVIWSLRRQPSSIAIMLEVDRRFQLQERLTTAMHLSEAERNSPAGQAVLADAQAQIHKIQIEDQFPVRPRATLGFVPLAAGVAALAFFFPLPVAKNLLLGDEPAETNPSSELENSQNPTPPKEPFTKRNRPPELAERKDKSVDLLEIEAEINELIKKYESDPKNEDPEKLREKVAEMTALEQKIKQFNQEKRDRLEKLEKQLETLNRLNQDKDFEDGPAKNLNDALKKGDLDQAKEELDQLKKKAKNKQLDEAEKEQLKNQLDKMREQLQRESKEQAERKEKLKEMIDQAKKEGRSEDAESLERELEQLKQAADEAKQASEQLAQSLKQAKEAMDTNDLEELAKALENASKQLEATEAELKDLDDGQEFLQRLKDEKKEACKKCEGTNPFDEISEKDDADWSPQGGLGKGRRKEDKDGKTSAEDQRIRGVFDKTGKKSYSGAVKGQAFKTASTGELGPAIQSAAQEAPAAADSQRLPRDAKQSVKEYFEKLGDQPEGGK